MKFRYIVIIFLSLELILVSIMILRNNVNLSPKGEVMTGCNTLYYNSKSAINIVIFSNKETAKTYADYLLSVSPYNTNSKSFNFYYINNYKPICTLYEGIALFCYNQDIVKKSSICPNDFIVAIDNKDPQIRSSDYMNTISINTNNPLSVFPHEFGHSFATLDDEYVPAKLSYNSKNCKSSCTEFGNSECFIGCSESDYYRSVDNGIMRTLQSNSYGNYDEQLILNDIQSKTQTITGNDVSDLIDCTNQKYYWIVATYSNGEVKLISKTLENGCAGGSGNGDFKYTLINDDNTIVAKANFNPESLYSDAQINGENSIDGGVSIYDGEFFLEVPYSSQTKNLEILDNNDQVKLNVFLGDINSRPCQI